jgi:hypothetical protein
MSLDDIRIGAAMSDDDMCAICSSVGADLSADDGDPAGVRWNVQAARPETTTAAAESVIRRWDMKAFLLKCRETIGGMLQCVVMV